MQQMQSSSDQTKMDWDNIPRPKSVLQGYDSAGNGKKMPI